MAADHKKPPLMRGLFAGARIRAGGVPCCQRAD